MKGPEKIQIGFKRRQVGYGGPTAPFLRLLKRIAFIHQ